MSTPTTILRDAARADAARPRLTWYDQSSGERIELSGTSLINWVDKTAHLLQGELGVGVGGTIALDLPRHWLTAVWWLAADAVGATATLGPDDAADVAVIGPDGLQTLPPNDEVVAVSLRPMGAGFEGALPGLVRDYTSEVRLQPDHFSPSAPGSGPAGAQAEQLASDWRLTSGDRVASAGPWTHPDAPLTDLLAPLAAGGSALWIRNPQAVQLVSLIDGEGITAWVGDPPAGLVLPPAIRWLDRPSVS